MNAIEIIKYLRERNFIVKADGEYLELSPPEKITDELIQRLKKHKPAIIAELKREERRGYNEGLGRSKSLQPLAKVPRLA